jgi:hypothetical protein
MSVSVIYSSILTVKDTLSAGVGLVSQPVVTHDGLNTGGDFSGTTTPAVTKVASGTATLSSGAATINLAALTGPGGAPVDFTGLKVQFAKITAPATNANDIVITPGASNGIDLFGGSSSLTIRPGMEILVKFNDQGPDVASGDRTIDLAGTGSQTLNYEFVAG